MVARDGGEGWWLGLVVLGLTADRHLVRVVQQVGAGQHLVRVRVRARLGLRLRLRLKLRVRARVRLGLKLRARARARVC